MSNKAYILFTFYPLVFWIQRYINEYKQKGTIREIFLEAYLKQEVTFPLRIVCNIFIA
jgi:hypothetical protein